MKLRYIFSTVVIFTAVAVYGGNVKDQPSNDWEIGVSKRIHIMGTIRWKTLRPMAKCFYTKYFHLPSYVEQEPLYDFKFNEDLTLENGERLTFRMDKPVRIDILNGSYTTIELYRNGRRVITEELAGRDVMEYDGLKAGLYKARLTGHGKSDFIEFEVADDSCSATMVDGVLRISGMKNGLEPLAIYFHGERSAETRLCRKADDGTWIVPDIPAGISETRIHFAGKYSGFLTEPVKIN